MNTLNIFKIFCVTLGFLTLFQPSVFAAGWIGYSKTADELLASRGEVTTVVQALTALKNTGSWPEEPFQVGVVSAFEWGQQLTKNFDRDYKQYSFERRGEVQISWPKNPTSGGGNKVSYPFLLTGAFAIHDGMVHDSLENRGNLMSVRDDPFLLGRGLVFVFDQDLPSDKAFQNVAAFPASWAPLLVEAHAFRKANAAAFTGSTISKEDFVLLKQSLSHTNEIIRCLAFSRFLDAGAFDEQTLRKTVLAFRGKTETAVCFELALDEAQKLASVMISLATDAGLKDDLRVSAALGAYVKFRFLESQTHYPSDSETFGLLKNPPEDMDRLLAQLPANVSTVLRQPAVRALVELGKWRVQQKDDSRCPGLPWILRIYGLRWPLEGK